MVKKVKKRLAPAANSNSEAVARPNKKLRTSIQADGGSKLADASSPKAVPEASPKLSSDAVLLTKSSKKKRKKAAKSEAIVSSSPKTSPKAGPVSSPKQSPKLAPAEGLSVGTRAKKRVKKQAALSKASVDGGATDGGDGKKENHKLRKKLRAARKANSVDVDEVETDKTGAQDNANSLKIFVGGIPWSTTEEDLRHDFEECGEIDTLLMLKDDQDRFKGVAFITYKTTQAVEQALKFDGDDYGGRPLKVSMATNRRDAKSGKGKGKGKGKDEKGKGKDEKGKGKKGKGKGKDGKSKGKDGKSKSKDGKSKGNGEPLKMYN